MTIKTKKLTQLLAATEPKIRAIYVGSYIPRECGIATFTKDLTNAINLLNPLFLADIVAIDDQISSGIKRNYPWEVKYRIDQESLESWLSAAAWINNSCADIVNIQHEFGLYGGKKGEYVIPFVEAITKPIVVSFHTMIASPDDEYLKIVTTLCKKVDGVVVMAEDAKEKLVNVYSVDPDKIVVIPHGVPDIPFAPTIGAKRELGLGDRTILSSFGLLNRGKGYELVLEALPKVLKKFPDLQFLIIGETHPVVARLEGEKYRNKLRRIIKKLNLRANVKFVNRYLSLDELVDYLKATDIYITPYPNLQQVTSGTLAYAIGAGKACISTPYIYAKEIMQNERGLLISPDDREECADAILKFLKHPRLREKYAKNAYIYGRNMIWASVALKHLDLFEIIVKGTNGNCQ